MVTFRFTPHHLGVNKLFSCFIKSTYIAFVLLLVSSCGGGEIYTAPALSSQSQAKTLVETSDISYDGKYSLIADEESVCLWNNLTTQLQLPCLTGKAKDYIEIVKISKSNEYFITSNRVSVRLYSISTGKLVGEWSLQDHIINDIALSKKSDVILLGFRSGKVSVINPFTKAMATYQQHKLDVNSVTISDDGVWAFTGASDKTAKYWNTLTGETIHSFEHMTRVNHVAMSQDQSVGFSIDAIKDKNIWDLKTGKLIAELDSHTRFMVFNDSEISPDNSLMLSGSPKRAIQLWRLSDGKLIAEWESAQQRKRSNVLSIAFKGNTLLSSTSDGILETWQLPSQAIINMP